VKRVFKRGKEVAFGGEDGHSRMLLSDTISKLYLFVSNKQFDLNCVINQQFTNMFVSFTVTTNTAIIAIINE
jgi:hypothetical protein